MTSSAPPRQVVDYSGKQVQIFSSAEDLQRALGPYISSLANNAVKARGQFTVAFSGGSLPATVGAALTTPSESLALAATIAQWRVFFADERLVPLSDSESNYSAVHKSVLSRFPFVPERVHTVNEALLRSPTEAAADYQAAILAAVPDGVLDLVLLGIGPDGHTCSLFPGHALVDEKERLVASIVDSPKPPPERITMTFPLVNRARHALFVVTGDKADALHGALDEPEKRLPAGLVNAESTAFFVDQKAASKLSKAKL